MSYKKSTHTELLEYSKTHPVQQCIKVARVMLESAIYEDNMVFTTHVHGEICETILEIIVNDYCRNNPEITKDWYCSKGLIIKDINNPNSGYFTELDYTVFTPQKIYAFECKSYGGDKKIADICTIKKKRGGSFDVYKQHYRHAEVLSAQLKAFRKRASLSLPGYQLALFNFSTGKTDDIRKNTSKLLMPCLDETNVTNIFKVYNDGPIIWTMETLTKAIKIVESHQERNAKKHLKYVMGLEHRKK